MKHSILIIIFLGCLCAANTQPLSQINYQGSDENFANPERGFYHFVSNVDYNTLVSFREEEAITLIYKNYKLSDYTDSEIPLWYLQDMENDFATMRKAGTKAVLRISYTNRSTPPYGDAPPEIVQMHIAQLKPYLQANSDVIYVLQAGFIGAWGEWYYTDYFSQFPGNISEENWVDRRAVVMSLLDAMPANRQVQVRTPFYKRKILQEDEYVPVGEGEAYTDTPKARISHHNDCFVADYTDMGTYKDTTIEKPYLAEDSKYTLVGGETCQVCECASCENSLKEMKRFHWSYLNIDYHTAVLQGWVNEGCFPTVEKKLGFRYRLVSATIQDEAKPGGAFSLTLKIVNDGWANPGNPRNVELILRNTGNSEEYYVPLSEDPRFWPLKDTIVVTVEAGFTEEMELGDYAVFLNLPDPDPRMADNPLYSIRTANSETWENESGFNSLESMLVIQDNPAFPDYTGGNLFMPKKAIAPDDVAILIDGKSDDWEQILTAYANPGQPAKNFKTYNNRDSLYFLVTGENLQSASQLFIDADLDALTGYAAWQWNGNGADYLIENDILYSYSGTDQQWGWTMLGGVALAHNDTVYEMGFSLNDLSLVPLKTTFSIGYVNDPEGSAETSYIPMQNEPFLVIHQVLIFGSPQAVDATSYTNNNIVFWANGNAMPGVYNVLERSEDGISYATVQVSESQVVGYADKALEENKSYSYRLKFMQGNTSSVYQGPTEITTGPAGREFIQIVPDGNPADWNLIVPSGTGFEGEMMAVRMTDRDGQLYCSLAGQDIDAYQFYFDTDQDNAFDFMISNDSLFSGSVNSWTFSKMVTSYSSANFLEVAIDLNDLDLADKDIINVAVQVNGLSIPPNSSAFTYSKAPVIPIPLYFLAEPSIDNYYTNSVIKWSKVDNTDGYILERSKGDSLNFEQIADLPNTAAYFVDSGLDSSFWYYYRMHTFNDIYRSQYTPIRSMKPGYGMGISDDLSTPNGRLEVSPNPFHQSTVLDIQVDSPEMLTVNLYDHMGRKVKKLYEGKVYQRKQIVLLKSDLESGLYIVIVNGPETHIRHKIIID